MKKAKVTFLMIGLCCMGLSSCGGDSNYRPTVSDGGDYHTIDGKRRQTRYKGSYEQQRDLDMIDEYMRTHPED